MCYLRPCRSAPVSFTVKGDRGVQHSVEVTAETLYKAAAAGVSLLRQEDWADGIGPGTQLEVRVKSPETTHLVTVSQIQRWCDGVLRTYVGYYQRSRTHLALGKDASVERASNRPVVSCLCEHQGSL